MTVEKEEKPQKIFELKTTIWDDGLIDVDMVEVVRQERGAPKKWLLERADFQASIKNQLSTTPNVIGDEILALMGFKVATTKMSQNSDVVEDDEEDFELE